MSPTNAARPRLAALGVAGAVAAWTAFLVNRGEDLDTWFHLGVGRWIVQHGKVPYLDPFSFTAAAERYSDSHWLFQVVLYAAHSLGGFPLLIFLQAACFLAAAALLWRSCAGAGLDGLKALVFVVIAPVIAERVLLRPDMLTFLFMAFFWRALFSRPAAARGWIIALPAVQVLWVNSHGLFMFGPVMAGAALAGALARAFLPLPPGLASAEERSLGWKALALVFAGVCAACFVSANGLDGIRHAFILYSEIGRSADSFMRSVSELKAPGQVFQLSPPILAYRLLVAGCVLTALANRRALSLSAAAVTLAFFHLAGQSVRNTAYFAFVAAPFLIRNAAGWLDRAGVPRWTSLAPILPAAAGFLLAAYVASDRYYVLTKDNKSFGVGRSDFIRADGAIAFVEAAGLKGNYHNDIVYGGALIWNWHPERLVYVDGRLEVYTPDFLRSYRRLTEAPSGHWDEDARRWGIEYAILSGISPYSERIIEHLSTRADWPLLYSDGFSAVYARRDGVNAAVVAKRLREKKSLLDESPAPVRPAGWRAHYPLEAFTRAKFCLLSGRADLARAEYRRILEARPDELDALRNLGALEARTGDAEAADALLRRALALDPSDAPTHASLGALLWNAGDSARAEPHLRRAIALQPDLAQAHAALGAMEYERGRLDEAVERLEAALHLEPNDAVSRFNLGACRLKQGRRDDAVAEFKLALSLKPDYAQARDVLKRLGR